MNLTIKKSNKKSRIKDDFSVDDDEVLDICGLVDGDVEVKGTLLRTFDVSSVESTDMPKVSPIINNTNSSDLNKDKSSTIPENKNQILNNSHPCR